VPAPALFLSDAELRELTGRAWKAKQAEWLRANHIPFYLNAMQRPIVTRAAIVHNEPPAVFPKAEKWNPAILRSSNNQLMKTPDVDAGRLERRVRRGG
jgi:hypothetical protein